VSNHQIKLETFGLTDRGTVRRRNEDQFLIADLAKSLNVRQTSLDQETAETFSEVHGHVLLVADGMGGHAAGREASTIAVETIRRYLVHTMPWFLSLRPEIDQSADAELKVALEDCHAAVLAAGRGQPEREGMGTTMTLAYVVWPWLYLVHVGDSRCYLLRDGQLRRITRDHTYAQKLIDEGGLTPDQAEDSFLSNVLTRVIGGDSDSLEVDADRLELQPGDVLLLATDGLSKHVRESTLLQVMGADSTPERCCRRLVEAALEGGGSDNVTVVMARFTADDAGEEAGG
jgi:protein phosphatase